MVRFAHEVRDPSSQLYIKGVQNVEFKRPPPGHTYLWCDRAIGQIKANAALVHGGIWAGHITPELPKEFHHHTWEACVIGNPEKKIQPCMMNGNPYRYHKVDQDFFDGYKDLFSSPLSTLAPVGTPLKYRDTDGNIGGDFNISEVCHVVARDGGVWCRTSFVDAVSTNPWLELPLLRPAHKPRKGSARPEVVAVQWETRGDARAQEPPLGSFKPHTAPYKLSPLKVRDLHHLARLLCPSGELDAVYPPPDSEELAQAMAAERAEKKGRGGHYEELDEETVAEAVATSEQPPAEEADDDDDDEDLIGDLQFKVADHVANDVPNGPTGAACVHCEEFFDVPVHAGQVSTFHGPCCPLRAEEASSSSSSSSSSSFSS